MVRKPALVSHGLVFGDLQDKPLGQPVDHLTQAHVVEQAGSDADEEQLTVRRWPKGGGSAQEGDLDVGPPALGLGPSEQGIGRLSAGDPRERLVADDEAVGEADDRLDDSTQPARPQDGLQRKPLALVAQGGSAGRNPRTGKTPLVRGTVRR